MNTKTKGSITEAVVLGILVSKGYKVCVPWGENCPYDFVVDMDGVLRKVQCKTGQYRNGSVCFGVSNTTYSADVSGFTYKGYKKGTVDYFAVHCEELGKTYLIPESHIGSKMCCLRVDDLPSNCF